MECRKINAQLLVDVACTVEYFNESCEIVPLTKEYVQVEHILLMENGLSEPKLFVKLPRNKTISSPVPSLRQKKISAKSHEFLSEYIEFNNDSSDESERKLSNNIEEDMVEIKKLLQTEIKENRQHKQVYMDLHSSVKKKLEEISSKVSTIESRDSKVSFQDIVDDEECGEDTSFCHDPYSIDKCYIDEPQKQDDQPKFDLNSVSEYFPLTSHNEILAFENKIRREYDFKEKMIKTLYQVGGENARVACRKLAKLIFVDEILTEYSYEGAQSKKKFKEFSEIIEIIFLAVYNRFNDYTMEQHKSGLSDHLRYASSRLKKRKNAIILKLDSNSKKSKFDDMDMASIEYSQ